MTSNAIRYTETRDLPLESVLALYRATEWSAAEKQERLHKALQASHSSGTAGDGARLVGLGNPISDGYLLDQACSNSRCHFINSGACLSQ